MKLRPAAGLDTVVAPLANVTVWECSVSTRITRIAAKMNRIGMPILASFSMPPESPFVTTQKLIQMVNA